MVCDHVLYRTVVQTAFFLGIMAGEMFFGTMSDSRFLLVGSVRGIIETGFVLVTELVIPKKRIMANAVMNYVYVLEQQHDGSSNRHFKSIAICDYEFYNCQSLFTVARVSPSLPIVLYGIVSLIAADMALLFPETLNRSLLLTKKSAFF
ncbi:unnamed protein product [Rotaria sp. Silwood1]|nr:unnamed protein product [Rotaria sp. Silwood1]